MTDDEFIKLNNLLDAKLQPLKDDLVSIKEDVEAIRETTQATAVAIDKQIGVNKDLESEQAAAHGQLIRHEDWIKKLAEKTEIKLEY